MGAEPNRTTADACRPLAETLLKVRKVGIVSEPWIARALEDALATHTWRDKGSRPYRPGLGRRIASLVYSRKDGPALSSSLAGLVRHERVLEQVRGFFTRSGLAQTGIPVDHRDAGRNGLMGAMVSRFIYDGSPSYQLELARQGTYTLLHGSGEHQVNQSILCVDALGSDTTMWAFHLFRNVGDTADMLRWRMGVFLPESPPTALLSASRWIDPEPLIRRCFDEEAAEAIVSAIGSRRHEDELADTGLRLLTFRTDNEGQLIGNGRIRAFGYLRNSQRPGLGTLEQLGLRQRNVLTEAERAITPQLNADQIQTLADAGEVLEQIAALKGRLPGA